MTTIYKITVHPDYRWSDIQIASRGFSKRSVTELSEPDMNPEIKRAGDEGLLVIKVTEVQEEEDQDGDGQGEAGQAQGKKPAKPKKPGKAEKPKASGGKPAAKSDTTSDPSPAADAPGDPAPAKAGE